MKIWKIAMLGVAALLVLTFGVTMFAQTVKKNVTAKSQVLQLKASELPKRMQLSTCEKNLTELKDTEKENLNHMKLFVEDPYCCEISGDLRKEQFCFGEKTEALGFVFKNFCEILYYNCLSQCNNPVVGPIVTCIIECGEAYNDCLPDFTKEPASTRPVHFEATRKNLRETDQKLMQVLTVNQD